MNPVTEYGKSKLAAENLLLEMGKKYSIHIVNLRLTMVYGSGGKGNLEKMSKLIQKGLFPPIPETLNHRSLVHIRDVLDVILLVMRDSRADDETFIISGPESPSGREIYNQIRHIYGFKKISFEIPRFVLEYVAQICQWIEQLTRHRMPFNQEVLSRLIDSAWYSSKKIEDKMNWYPKIGLSAGLLEMIGYSKEIQTHETD